MDTLSGDAKTGSSVTCPEYYTFANFPRTEGEIQRGGNVQASADISEFRDGLVRLYRRHNPANVDQVDNLLARYKGQEKFLHHSAWLKHEKATPEANCSTVELVSCSVAGPPSSRNACREGQNQSSENSVKDSCPVVSNAASSDNQEPLARSKAKTGQPKPGSLRQVAEKPRVCPTGSALPATLPETRNGELLWTLPHGTCNGQLSEALQGTRSNTLPSAHAAGDRIRMSQSCRLDRKFLAEIDTAVVGCPTGFFDGNGDDSFGMDEGSSEYTSESDGDSSSVASASEASQAGPSSANVDANGRASQRPHVGSDRNLTRNLPTQTTNKSCDAKRPPAPGATTPDPSTHAPQQNEEPKSSRGGGPSEHDSESDIDDSQLAGALGAMLKPVGVPTTACEPPPLRPPPPTRPRKDETTRTQAVENRCNDTDGFGYGQGRGSDSKPAVESQGVAAVWGAPPPLRTSSHRVSAVRHDDRDTHVKTVQGYGYGCSKASPQAQQRETDLDGTPPLFNQWLACLKFVTGWNDQGSYSEEQVRRALREHLLCESICQPRCIANIASTIVPLLLDLRKIDAVVVKRLRPDVLRGLKVVQVSILRIVTFELCREQEAKDVDRIQQRKNKRNGDLAVGKSCSSIDASTKPYLASDIGYLAKVVQHFRFDRSFNQGLRQLIISIRKNGRETGRNLVNRKRPAPRGSSGSSGHRRVGQTSKAVRSAASGVGSRTTRELEKFQEENRTAKRRASVAAVAEVAEA